jgi:4-aminobutyrate aminotransferase/(S)-3-amino-2-methylpropionate transaminase
MNASERLLARRAAVVPQGVPRATRATVETASGALLRDADGRELIDFAGGLGVMNAGHCQERVVAAIQRQAGRLLHTCIHVATYEPYVELCEKLVELLPHGDRTKAMLVNSGAEAVENAVKIARQATGRQALICFSEAFHGRTLLGMTLTSKVAYKQGCGPFAPEVYRVPFPNHYRYGAGLAVEAFVERELRRFRHTLASVVAPEQVAAVLIEPVQGEGGFVPAPPGYLQGLRRACDEHGILLILDEVQTGFCRTGSWAAYEQHGVVPDLSTWAKSMGGGLPIGAVVGRADVMDAARPGTIGGTYGGNPVACAAALATIELMLELRLGEKALEIGKVLRERFLALQRRCPSVIGDVRGQGAMQAIELVEDADPERPATKLVGDVTEACVERGLLVLSAGTYGNVIRVLAPLVIRPEDLERGLAILEEVLLARVPRSATPTRRSPPSRGRRGRT